MKPSRGLLVVTALCLVALLWFYGLSIWDFVRARTAEVSAMTELPRLWFDIPVVLLALAVAAVVAVGLLQKKDASWKGFRLMPILFVVVLFVDVFVLSGAKLPVSSADHSAIALHVLARELQGKSQQTGIPEDPNMVEAAVKEMGQPPFLVRGQRPERFSVQVRKNCQGPVLDAPGAAAGTFLYCAAPDRSVAWITLVGLPAEVRFGSPALFSRAGVVQVVTVEPQSVDLAMEAEGLPTEQP